jgi:enterochelin esterase-like enzyme
MRRSHNRPQGRIERLFLDCPLLAANLLGDPTQREVHVYLPPGHDGRGLPLLVDFVGYTAGGPAHTNWKNFGESVPERLDRLIGDGAMSPMVVAFPDCFTRLGGNQYINSLVLGPWMDALCDHMVPTIEALFSCGGSERRGVFGKSSGGYGALAHALLRADFWAAAACHSGDMGFELCYLPDMPGVLRALDRYGGSVAAFMAAFEGAAKVDGQQTHVLMSLCMAASYDPDPASPFGVRLPVDPYDARLLPDRWEAWMAHDPLRMAEQHGENLRRLKGLYIDCGVRDQYNLLYGARRLHVALTARGIAHRYEEFPDDHSGIDYRMDVSLPFLAACLAGTAS